MNGNTKCAIKVIDCTLRDGGYYNKWNFSIEIVQRYLDAISKCHVDVVEMGFRFPTKNRGLGPCAYTTDAFLQQLHIPEHMSVAVMVNGADLCEDQTSDKIIDELFPRSASDSHVEIVRIACHFYHLEKVLPYISILKNKGFSVIVNIMQITDRSESDLRILTQLLKNSGVEALYFADSIGGMSPADICRVVACLKNEWKNEIGIHAHDNMGLAMANTLAGIDAGVTWVDATISGMGRGAGNTPTELLVTELSVRYQKNLEIDSLLALLATYFLPLKDKFRWGSNPYYYLAGKLNIHPSYIQSLLVDTHSSKKLIGIIEQLGKQKATAYNEEVLAELCK